MSTEVLDHPATHDPAEIATGVAVVLQRTSDPSLAPHLLGKKTTIGSGRSCTLQLEDEGVKSLHCLITSSESGWMVRRWSDGTLLNGESFTESPMQLGDRLSIGPVELELSEYEASQPEVALDEAAVGEPCDKDHSYGEEQANEAEVDSESESAVDVDSIDEVTVNESHPSTAHARRRARSLVQVLRSRQRELQLHQSQVAELEARINDVELQRDQLVSERDLLLGQLESLTEELSNSRLEITAERSSHQSLQQEFAEQLRDLEAQVAARNELVLDLQTEIERQRADLQSTVCETPQGTEPVSPSFNLMQENDEFLEPLETEQTRDQPSTTLDEAVDQADVSSDPDVIDCSNSQHTVEAPASESDAEVTDSVEPATEQTPSVAVPPSEMWDVEAQVADDDQGGQLEAEKDAGAAVMQEPEDESALFGRLNSLRAAASEKLHHELEAPTIHSSTENASDQRIQESAGLGQTLDPVGRIGEDSGESEPEETSDEIAPVATEPASELADESADAPIDEPVDLPPAGATTLFDAQPSQKPEINRDEPVSYVEKFKHLLQEDGEDTPGPEPVVQSVVQPAAAVEPAADLSEDDESIEDYMAKMMSRLRGAPEALSPETVVAEEPAKPTVVQEPVIATAATIVEQPPLTNLDSLKSQPRPEHATDMTALRDLANSSAREAIKLSQSRKRRDLAVANLVFSFIAGSAGGYMVWASNGEMGVPLFGGAAAVIASGYWGSLTLRSLLTRSGPKQLPNLAAIEAEKAAAGASKQTDSAE